MKDLSNYRKSYEKKALLEDNTPEDPMVLFRDWFYEVEADGHIDEVNAMHISTVGKDGFPKNRVVLLKKYTYEGFIFYTNYLSEKGKAIAENNNICLSFFWQCMERQVIIKGKAEFLSENLSDGYFESRPLGSQLGAIVSPQSEIIPNREFLEDNLKKLEQQYQNNFPERPTHWGGYLVRPVSIEFWQGRPNRLHDRIRYDLNTDFNWTKVRLAP
jgi:pyridoxamine 5'-phosphate oxidase